MSVSNANGCGVASCELQSLGTEHSELPIFEGGNVTISIQVLQQVTNNFSEDNILGRGGFGVVYKGELHDGTKIDVKRMESVAMESKKMNDFQAEIAALTKVRDRHLVALLGYCINDNEGLLVYEYLPQGTLTQHLFEWGELRLCSFDLEITGSNRFGCSSWSGILAQLSSTKLHSQRLKTSNILLGDDMRAKVADFGLVKNAPDGKYSIETRLAGTFGYLAPEYAEIIMLQRKFEGKKWLQQLRAAGNSDCIKHFLSYRAHSFLRSWDAWPGTGVDLSYSDHKSLRLILA